MFEKRTAASRLALKSTPGLNVAISLIGPEEYISKTALARLGQDLKRRARERRYERRKDFISQIKNQVMRSWEEILLYSTETTRGV